MGGHPELSKTKAGQPHLPCPFLRSECCSALLMILGLSRKKIWIVSPEIVSQVPSREKKWMPEPNPAAESHPRQRFGLQVYVAARPPSLYPKSQAPAKTIAAQGARPVLCSRSADPPALHKSGQRDNACDQARPQGVSLSFGRRFSGCEAKPNNPCE